MAWGLKTGVEGMKEGKSLAEGWSFYDKRKRKREPMLIRKIETMHIKPFVCGPKSRARIIPIE